MGLPTVRFWLDDGTGTFPKNITSKVLLGPGFSYSRGRQDWQGGVTAGELTLTLDNSDGRFTAGSTFYGSPTLIKVDQRLRITETVNGITYNRFTGYVKQWPVAWPATVSSFATVQITVTDAQARGERRDLRSVLEEEIFADSPSAYYTLGDATGATSAVDSSGNQAPALAMAGTGTDVAFGAAGPSGGSTTGASFAGGKYLVSKSNANLGAWVITFSTTASGTVAIAADGIAGSGNTLILVNGALGYGSASLGSGFNDGAFHTVSVRYTGPSNSDVYVDGAYVASTTTLQLTGPLTVGARADGTAPFTGTLAHVATFTTTPSAARAAAWGAARNGFAGESGTARLTRLAGYAGIPVGTLDTSLTNVPASDTSGRSAWDGIQEAVDAEGGVAFIDGSGNLTFHNRTRITVKTSPDLTLTAEEIIPPQATLDDQQILNYVETTATATGVTQVARSATSETSHGRYSGSLSYLVQTDAEALDRGNWVIANFAEPTPRYGSVTIDLYGMTDARRAVVLSALEIDCWMRINNMPAQNPGGSSVDLVVEGYSEDQSSDTWTIACNVVSKSLFSAWILGSASAGVLGSTTRLYV